MVFNSLTPQCQQKSKYVGDFKYNTVEREVNTDVLNEM